METQEAAASSKDHILKAFRQLLAERTQGGPKIATKQEAAEREEDKRVVEKASTYTVESIVKGLADLQLNFGNAVGNLTTQLAVEAPKLQELQRAIRVEMQYLEELRHIRIAADALDILIQEYQEKTRAFEGKSQQERQALDSEIIEQRQAWQKEQKEFEAALKARQDLLKKEREQREADYQYELERKRKIEADEYTNHKAVLERQIAENDATKGADWTEREKVLTEQQETLKKYQTLVESFSQKLADATRKSREEAISEVYEDAKVQAELFEKELQADQEVAELKIASLQKTIDDQTIRLEQLSTQLQTSLKQMQGLAASAVGSGGKIERSV